MRIVSLDVQHFACIKRARLQFAPGFNLLYGRNDIGKSTLVQAIRAGLLLPHSSSAAAEYVPWQQPDAEPKVELTLELMEGGATRFYRVRKVFGRSAHLEWSNDGINFGPDKAARAVDEKLRQLLQWGVPEAGSSRGMPDSFLLKVLLASQPEVTAVLGVALGDDKDPSGKQRIMGALEAMLEEPLFKQVVARAMQRVSEAFSKTGRRRMGKGSPWIELRDKINAAEQELAQLQTQRDQSATVLAKLRQLDDEVLVCAEAVSLGMQQLEQVTAGNAERQRVELLHARVAAALVVLEERQKKLDAAARARAEETALSVVVTEATEQVRVAQATLDLAKAGIASVEAQVRQLESADAIREVQLKQSQLREKRTQHQADIEAERRKLELGETVAAKQRERGECQARINQLEQTAATRHTEAAQREVKVTEAGRHLEAQRALLKYWRYRDAAQQLEHAEAAQKTSLRYGQAAREQRDRAMTIELELDESTLPSHDELAKLRALHHEVQVQEAAQNLGLTAALAPSSPPVDVEVSIDDAATTKKRLVAAITVEGKRTLQFKLPGVNVEVSVGGADQVRKLAELRATWKAQVAPAVEAAGVATFAALEVAVTVAQAKRDEAQELKRSAAEKAAAFAGLAAQAARRQSLSRQVESGRVALAECDLNELEASAAAFSDEAEVAELLRKAEEMAKAAEVARNTASNALTLIQAQLEAARVELQAADAADHEAAQRVPGDFLGALAKSKERLVSLGAQLAELEAELARLTHAKNEELELVKKKLQLAQTAERSAFDQLESNRSQLTAAKQRLDEHRGGLTLLEAAAASADIQGATKAVQIAKDELAAATAPGAGAPFPTDSDVATAREKLELAEVAFHAKRTEQAEARGSLLQVRGDVIVEEVTDATAALAQHKREREELEVEYGAWQLLEATLREAEKSEATNLGDRLAAPVQQRFSALTGGRYAKVEVGPDLRTAGFVAAGETRDVATLSAGTQEQLSTIFRLCLAEALQTAVILDDHLSQTDSQRMAWFRNALDEVAGKAQVIVISCWPEHYAQAAAGIDSGAGIDASAVIERY